MNPFLVKFICALEINSEANISKLNTIWGLAGQIKSFRWPHLARGPYVVHAFSKRTLKPTFATKLYLDFCNTTLT